MKYLLFASLIVSLFWSCDTAPAEASLDMSQYPTELVKVLDAHGGLNTWRDQRALSYEIVKEGQNELQQIDLQTRRERIEAADFKTGYDGEQFWLEADTSYSGNPVFYHNLMFYFYAMPFVLADDGIVHGGTEPLVYDSVSYPGIRISYEEGVGVSSQDEYYLHYDAETYEMTWLGYTVTYFSGQKADKVSWIRYDDWQTFSGVKLPKSMEWYKVEEGKITEPRRRRSFDQVTLSAEPFADEIFAPTADAEIVEQ